MKRFFLILFCVLISLLISSCRADIKQILENSTCSPPCFFEITPGVTSDEVVKEILRDDLSLNNIRVGNSTWGNNGYTLTGDFDQTQRIEIFIQDEIVEAIWFWSLPRRGLNISVSELVKVYGEPKNIYINEFFAGDTNGYFFNLIYPEKNILMTVKVKYEKGFVNIGEKDRVNDIVFMRNDQYIDFMINIYDSYRYFYDRKLLSWKGFGKYDVPPDYLN